MPQEPTHARKRVDTEWNRIVSGQTRRASLRSRGPLPVRPRLASRTGRPHRGRTDRDPTALGTRGGCSGLRRVIRDQEGVRECCFHADALSFGGSLWLRSPFSSGRPRLPAGCPVTPRQSQTGTTACAGEPLRRLSGQPDGLFRPRQCMRMSDVPRHVIANEVQQSRYPASMPRATPARRFAPRGDVTRPGYCQESSWCPDDPRAAPGGRPTAW